MNFSTVRRATSTVAGLGMIAATTVVLTASPANAAVLGMRIDPGPSTGSSGVFGLGCTYTVSADVNDGGPVYFGAQELSGFAPPEVRPVNGQATTQWTPRTLGTYLVTASTGEGAALTFQNVKVTVKPALRVGPGCLVSP